MLAYSAVEYVLFSAMTLLFYVGAYFTARSLQRALRTGTVSYGGNSPRTAASKTYRRTETPGMYWYGIGLGVIMTATCLVMGGAFTFMLASN